MPLEFCLLHGEVAEAFDAWRQGREDVGEELADVAIYLQQGAAVRRRRFKTIRVSNALV